MMPNKRNIKDQKIKANKNSLLTIKSNTKNNRNGNTKLGKSKSKLKKTEKTNFKESRKRTKEQLRILESFYA